MKVNAQRGGVIGRLLAAFFLFMLAVAVISSINADKSTQGRKATENAEASQEFDQHQSKLAKTKTEFAANRTAILADLRGKIAAAKWEEAAAITARWSDIVSDPEYAALGAAVYDGNRKVRDAQAASDAKVERARKRREGVQIGMTQDEVLQSNWGRPESVNRSVYSFGVHEQWIYPGFQYLFFENGKLTSIHAKK